jgi:hypothetical protein
MVSSTSKSSMYMHLPTRFYTANASVVFVGDHSRRMVLQVSGYHSRLEPTAAAPNQAEYSPTSHRSGSRWYGTHTPGS